MFTPNDTYETSDRVNDFIQRTFKYRNIHYQT